MFYYITPALSAHISSYPCLPNQMNLFLLNLHQNATQIPQNSGGLYTSYKGEEISQGYLDHFTGMNFAPSLYFGQNQQNQPQQRNSVEKIENQKNKQGERTKNRSNSDTIETTSKQEDSVSIEIKESTLKKKKSETKNLIKNYGRAILTFMIKQKELRVKVLSHLNIDDLQFLEEVHMYRNHIHTISAIRYLWQHHPFCQAFRILSCEYLRKYNLEHIFNSRVFKYSVYLKYQQKLMKSMQRPQQFESIKQD